MKQRITGKDIKKLTEEQSRRLNELWTPALYDVAVAKVLKNVATDEYDEYEFVIGGISLHGTSIYLADLAAAKNQLPSGTKTSNGELSEEEAPDLDTKSDPVFGESLLSYGGPGTFNIAANGIMQAFEDTSDVDSDEADEEDADGDEDADDDATDDEEPDEDYQEDDFQDEDLEDNYQRPVTHTKNECTPLLTIGEMIEILQKNNFGKYDFFLTASTYEIGCEIGRDDSSWENNRDWEPAELCDVLWESIKDLL